MRTKTNRFRNLIAGAAATAMILTVSSGCEDNKSDGGSGGDAVAFSKLEFRYGAPVNSGNLVCEGVKISNLSVGKNSWSFNFDVGMDAWGYGAGHLEPLCAFMKTKDGKWIGGMMHWQGPGATAANNFHNVYHPGYIGFTDVFNHIPNPCEIAFVLIDNKGKRRSNVIKSTWAWNESRRQ